MHATSTNMLGSTGQDCIFFTRLNFDIRMMIYNFLYEQQPALSYKWFGKTKHDFRGMILACKQASEELSYAAALSLKKSFESFAADFESDHSHSIQLHNSIPLHQGWTVLNVITLSVDISILSDVLQEQEGASCVGFDAEGTAPHGKDSQWRLLLERPFEKVTLLVNDTRNTSPGCDTESDWNQSHKNVVHNLRMILLSLEKVISGDWWYYQLALDRVFLSDYSWLKNGPPGPIPRRRAYSTTEEYRFARIQYERLSTEEARKKTKEIPYWQGYTELKLHRIQTKQICFAWDFVPTDSPISPSTIKLEGKKYLYSARTAEKLRRKDHLPPLRYDAQWPHKYEVSGANQLVGEMGLRHPKRWNLASEEVLDKHNFTLRWSEQREVESEGIGKEIKEKALHTEKDSSRNSVLQ